MRRTVNDRDRARLRPLDAGNRQLGDLHPVRVQFLQAADQTRLALLRGFFSSAFLVALFTEMYGYPLTIYFLSGWLQSRYPEVNWLAHDAGHLLEMLFGWKANPHFGPFHVLSMVFIGGGFWLLAAAWRVLYAAQKTRTLAVSGPYARIRHPQYTAFILIMFGFLLQWPTILTLLMFPVLVYMYAHLADARRRRWVRVLAKRISGTPQ